MLTRVVAKQAKSTKVKNKFVNGKKVQKKNLGEKNFAIKFRRKVQICLVSSVANSVGTLLEFAAFRSGFDAKYSRAKAFCFFSVHNHGFFTVVRTHFARKNTTIFMLIGSFSRRKK